MTTKTERAAAIRWIQDQMADYDLTMEELRAAGCFDPPRPTSATAGGLLPERRGPELERNRPDGLRRAVNAGQSVEFYQVG
ncbi:DNA-binding protein (plasmid) [Cupriavidus necator]|nr:DNA-binding protein [Cupriavidus necator]